MQQQKILLLENVATQAAGVREHLSQAGLLVTVSRYEADGLKRLVEWQPDLVLVSTAHPAGDFVEYCRRVRALAPAVRIVVTSSHNRDQLFQEHPALSAIVDGVLQRPFPAEEVMELLVPAPVATGVPAGQAAAEAGIAELRAEFQRQLDARFLEVEELKRHLEVASRRAASAPGLEWLQSENDHLRQGVEETRKKAALALATEQLKRSEIEVKLDNLLRMKEDFEFRAQNELEERSQELELARGQLQELRASSDKAAAGHATLRVELERALIEKEQIEERLHALDTGGREAASPEARPADAERIAELEAELSRQRALAAEGQVALADTAAKAAMLEETLARVPAAREERERLLAQARTLREEAAQAQRQAAQLEEKHETLREKLAAAESASAVDRAALHEATGRVAATEQELAGLQRARAEDEDQARQQRDAAAAREQELLERVGDAERRNGQLQSACSDFERRLGASEAARVSVAAEAEALVEQRGAEVAASKARAEELSRELEPLRAFKAAAETEKTDEAAELLARELAESRTRARELTLECERLSELLAQREQQIATLREELTQRERQLATVCEELAAVGEAHERELRGRLEIADAALADAREGFAARERELLLQLADRETAARAREEQLAARVVPEAPADLVQPELQRIQQLLEEVFSRARTEAVDYARRDAELSVRLQAALDERRLLQERFDRVSAETSERERRSASLLQSAIDHRAAPPAERANLPAVVPQDPGPAPRRSRRLPVFAGLAVLALGAVLAFLGLRQSSPRAVPERRPALPRPQAAGSPGAAVTPREVWDRWTRSDGSGGVLVQATLRSEQELRAEVEADRARGMSDEEARAELARRSSAFRFDTTWYVSVYLKNLSPGYPAYLDDLPGRFRLRDGSGKEVPAFLPPGHEKDRRVFSFGAGAPGDLFYEASVSLGFDRAGLSPSAGYLQLVVSDVGAASRRVLTWELE